MAGIREKKKETYKRKIIKVALQLFMKQGYGKTTMGEIANKVGIGVGTIYNYFKSKSELFLSLLAQTSDDIEINIENLKKDLHEELDHYIVKTSKSFTHFPKWFWREVFAVMADTLDESTSMRKGLMQFDLRFIEQLERLFKAYQEKDVLPSDFPVEDTTQVIYSILVVQLTMYIYTEDLPLEQVMERIRRQIKLVLPT